MLCVCGHARSEHLSGGHGVCLGDGCECGEFEPDLDDEDSRPDPDDWEN